MPNSGAFTRLAITLFIAGAVPLLVVSLPSYSQSVKRLKAEDQEIRQEMVKISRQLGVECTTCHSSKNFALTDKVEYRVAKEHMRITQTLIDNGFDGKDKRPKADCYLCHRGEIKPRYKEPFDPMTMEKAPVKVPNNPSDETE